MARRRPLRRRAGRGRKRAPDAHRAAPRWPAEQAGTRGSRPRARFPFPGVDSPRRAEEEIGRREILRAGAYRPARPSRYFRRPPDSQAARWSAPISPDPGHAEEIIRLASRAAGWDRPPARALGSEQSEAPLAIAAAAISKAFWSPAWARAGSGPSQMCWEELSPDETVNEWR